MSIEAQEKQKAWEPTESMTHRVNALRDHGKPDLGPPYDWYLSGPMTGIEDFNYPLFEKVATGLRANGYSVNSPHEHFNGDQTLSLEEYLRADIEAILKLHKGILVLPDWEDSPGAVTEVTVALAIGLEIRHVDVYAGLPDLLVYDGASTRQRLTQHFSNVGRITPLAELSQPGGANYDGVQLTTEERSVLLQAEDIINGARAKAYDHPIRNFQRICDGWSAIVGVEITAEQHALMMIWLKIARLMHTPDHWDSIVDIAGYTGTYEKVIRGREIIANGGTV